ncbi:TPA: IS3 family transposase [Haemophilus influenzae]
MKTECYCGKRFERFEQLEKTLHAFVHYDNHKL